MEHEEHVLKGSLPGHWLNNFNAGTQLTQTA
jgi:hypothetical protein